MSQKNPKYLYFIDNLYEWDPIDLCELKEAVSVISSKSREISQRMEFTWIDSPILHETLEDEALILIIDGNSSEVSRKSILYHIATLSGIGLVNSSDIIEYSKILTTDGANLSPLSLINPFYIQQSSSNSILAGFRFGFLSDKKMKLAEEKHALVALDFIVQVLGATLILSPEQVSGDEIYVQGIDGEGIDVVLVWNSDSIYDLTPSDTLESIPRMSVEEALFHTLMTQSLCSNKLKILSLQKKHNDLFIRNLRRKRIIKSLVSDVDSIFRNVCNLDKKL